MARDVSDTTPIGGRRDLVAALEAGCKPASRHRIGTEHEKIGFYRADLTPVPYDGAHGVGGIRVMLEELGEALGWTPILDGSNIIGLAEEDGGAISLEPGGQFELSGAPLATVHETAAELDRHFAALRPIADRLGISFLTLGMSPKWTREETPAMPKSRYAIMSRYMPKVGARGLDMMFRTATVQANYDFASEADMVRKLRVSVALQPLATALFANSPFVDGRLNGNLSDRSAVWQETDAVRKPRLRRARRDARERDGLIRRGVHIRKCAVAVLDGPIIVPGSSFHDLLAGRHPAVPGERATLSDWANHLSTIFPEVRLKTFLEMRGADAGALPFLTALPALFAGLYYHPASLDGAWDLVRGWSAVDREALRGDAPRRGLEAKIAGSKLRDVARHVLELSRAGLASRGRRDETGADETRYLDCLDEVVDGQSQAERLIESFKGPWRESVDPAFAACLY